VANNWRQLKQVWLNQPCSETWWAMYEAYIASPEWNMKRAFVLKRDGRRCRLCGDGQRLEVHHPPFTYDDLGNEPPGQLITLCRQCHEVVTNELHRRRGVERLGVMISV